MISVDILLTCNDPPDPAQTVAVQGILNEKSLALSALEAQIAALESKLEDLRQNRETLSSEILEFGAILAPIRRLPQEIVGEIFLYFAPGVPDMHIRPTVCPWKLAHVCRLWRSIASALGRLWSVLDVAPRLIHSSYYQWSNWRDTEPYTEYCVAPLATRRWEYAEEAELVRQLDLPITKYMSLEEAQELDEGCRVERTLEVLEECVQRAGTHPLSLLLSEHPSFALFPVFHALMKYSARWKDLVLDNPPEELWDSFPEGSEKFPLLTKIVLFFHSSPWGSARANHLDFRWAANLTDLTLGSIFLGPEMPLHIPWSQLTRYSERYCVWSNDGVRWAAYRQLTNVVVLLLDLSAGEQLTHPPESCVLLPNLQTAWFNLVPQEIYAVDQFDMPALHTLSILQEYVHKRPRRFNRIFPHPENAPNLKDLRIRSDHVIHRSEESACRLLDDFPELRTLYIDIGEIISTRFVTKLTPSRDGLSVLPKLEVLRLTNWSFIHQDCLWTTLAAMVQGRFRPFPDSGVRPLRTLRFFARTEWRPNNYKDPVVFAGLENLRWAEGLDIHTGRDSSTADFGEPEW
ncbi:hypothetical protein C8J57DRAFT_1322220 [Mycena rebaudengoi]|nr:hypothetical protein C8J57DRAFT_1322220 [Mycena rebaudengoi]